MAQAKSVHSTQRRVAPLRKTASTLRSPRPQPLPTVDPETLPDIYCMALQGDCLEPFIPDGASVALQKSATYDAGDIVCVWWRPEFIRPGMHQCWLKRIRLSAPHWVKKYPYNDHPESDVKALIVLEQLKRPQGYAVPCGHILAIHKAIGYIPAGGKIGGTVSSGDMLPIGGKGGGRHG